MTTPIMNWEAFEDLRRASDPSTTTAAATPSDDLLRLMVPSMTPQSDRRTLMTTSRPGSTGSSTPLFTSHQRLHTAPLQASDAATEADEQRRETEGNRVYEHG